MGYYTQYKLQIESDDEDLLRLFMYDFADSKVHSEYGPLNGLFDIVGNWSDSIKWYDHDKDLEAISEHYPNITFILDGLGEEAGDVWRAWYRNGDSLASKASLSFTPPPTEFFETVENEASKALKRRAEVTKEIDALKRELNALEQNPVKTN